MKAIALPKLPEFDRLLIACMTAHSTLQRCRHVQRQRQALARLSDDHLRDIGLNREDVERELARSYWDTPVVRHRSDRLMP
ncbi:DUF1127 domain-containing protein [Gammaproteobacteria bacterium]|nr:DUF1127 domain-containing protein [Gammaproteobacteria bacterium]